MTHVFSSQFFETSKASKAAPATPKKMINGVMISLVDPMAFSSLRKGLPVASAPRTRTHAHLRLKSVLRWTAR